MLILNYAHPLTDAHTARIAELTGASVDAVREIPAQLDLDVPFAEQAVALADAAGLSPAAWQTEPLLVVLPALNYAAAALLAELHGRMGYFPPVVRLRPVEGALPPRFEVAEIMDLQALRAAARSRR
ncbi:MAG: CRISPR-associated protein Csx15 [Anaerolineae bacterium]